METIRISELSQASSLQDLYTLGVDKDNRSVKVSLDYIKTQVDIVEEADAAAVFANLAADNAQLAADVANKAAEDTILAIEGVAAVVAQTMAIPSIEIRVVRNREAHKSIYFPDEETTIIVDKLQYRINGIPGQIDAFRREGWQVNLLRPRWIHAGKGRHYKKWASCEIGTSNIGVTDRYPDSVEFSYEGDHLMNYGTIWCPESVATFGRIDIPDGYNGEWLDLDNDYLEKLVRRYAYLQQMYFSDKTFRIVPLAYFNPDYRPHPLPEGYFENKQAPEEGSGTNQAPGDPNYAPVSPGQTGNTNNNVTADRTATKFPYTDFFDDDNGSGGDGGEPSVIPISGIYPDAVFLRIAGQRRRQCIYGRYKGGPDKSQNIMEVTEQVKYVSLPFAFALSKNIDGKHRELIPADNTDGQNGGLPIIQNTKREKRIDGPLTKFSAIYRRVNADRMTDDPSIRHIFQYTAKISGFGTPKTNSKPKTHN